MSEPMSTRMTALAARGRAVTYDAKRAVLSRLLRAWDAAPALRLGQLLLAACERVKPPAPLFAVEDERLADMVEAMAVVPEGAPLTPSEVALAKVLAALDSYPEPARLADGRVAGYTREIGAMWAVACAVGEDRWDRSSWSLTDEGRALLERARKAGVL